jgi:hypothetical protein
VTFLRARSIKPRATGGKPTHPRRAAPERTPRPLVRRLATVRLVAKPHGRCRSERLPSGQVLIHGPALVRALLHREHSSIMRAAQAPECDTSHRQVGGGRVRVPLGP